MEKEKLKRWRRGIGRRRKEERRKQGSENE